MKFNFFRNTNDKPPEPQKLPEPADNKDPSNSVTIMCDVSGVMHVLINVENNTPQAAEYFGKLLYYLNEGYYINTILDTLVDISKRYPENIEFTKSIIANWSKELDKNKLEVELNQDKPIVSPTHFYENLK